MPRSTRSDFNDRSNFNDSSNRSILLLNSSCDIYSLNIAISFSSARLGRYYSLMLINSVSPSNRDWYCQWVVSLKLWLPVVT